LHTGKKGRILQSLIDEFQKLNGAIFPLVEAGVSKLGKTSPGNLPVLCIVAVRTLILIILDVAARAKQSEIVARQSRNVHHSTGAPLFFCVLHEQLHREVSD
jgi:hypothetical protein